MTGLERIEAFFTGHAYDPHRHDTYALGLTLTGAQCFDYRGESRRSLSGDAIVLHPDERHDGRSGAEAGFRYRMLYLEPRLLREALAESARALPFVGSAVSDDPTLIRVLARALSGLERPFDELERDAVIADLGTALLALDPAVARRDATAPARRAAERARVLLDERCAETVTSADLEMETGLDRFSLARHFRAVFCTSPYNYLVMRRLDHARRLLRDSDAIADVAVACGFADQSHLTRQFRRAFGMTPGRWRRLQRPSA